MFSLWLLMSIVFSCCLGLFCFLGSGFIFSFLDGLQTSQLHNITAKYTIQYVVWPRICTLITNEQRRVWLSSPSPLGVECSYRAGDDGCSHHVESVLARQEKSVPHPRLRRSRQWLRLPMVLSGSSCRLHLLLQP